MNGDSDHGRNSHGFQLCLVIVGCCLFGTAGAQTQIHKCTDADGNVAYSQLPCPPPVTAAPDKIEPDKEAVTEIPEEEPEQVVDQSACKKRYRDAIDAIDAEIGQDYSPGKAEQYKERLLVLTRKLRQCG